MAKLFERKRINMFARNIKLLALLVISVFAVPIISAQDKPEANKPPVVAKEKSKKKKATGTNKKSEVNQKDTDGVNKRRRIVNTKTLKRHRSKIGSFLLKPFRSFAPIFAARLTKFEEDREYEILLRVMDMPISPKFGGVTEGSGFGVGFAASTKDYLSKDFRIFGSSAVTTKGYVGTSVGLEFEPRKYEKRGLRIRLTGEQLILPQQHFFGRGTNSKEGDETTFFHRKIGLRLAGEFRLNKSLKIGAFSEFTRNDITEGTDSEENSLNELYDSNTLPGLGRNIRLLDSGAFVQIEKLDSPGNPHSGWSTRFVFSNVNSFGANKFDWRNFKIDSRAYIPIGTKLRVLALRFQGDFKDVQNGGAIPVFRLARLGNSETLRGYETFRFQGNNSIHLSAEYRIRLMQGYDKQGFTGVEGVFFGDFGQVFDRRKEVKWRNIRATWGGGLRFMTKQSTALTLLYARSPEGGRIVWKLGKTF